MNNSNTIAGIGNNVTEFDTGAVRDIQEEKGRCDLMPIGIIADIYEYLDISPSVSSILRYINSYIYDGNRNNLYCAILEFATHRYEISDTYDEPPTLNEVDKFSNALLEVSMHYKNGTMKYGERNWEKGIPLHSYIDSGIRHFIKYVSGYKDERHDLAFMWNLLCCAHTDLYIDNDSLRDLPFCKK